MNGEVSRTTSDWSGAARTRNLMICGVLLLVVGLGLFLFGWTNLAEYPGDPMVFVVMFAGSLAAAIGQVMALISVIAMGVRLGNAP